MAQHPSQNTSGMDSDSFLDIVANIVGILIILVMVVGLRIQRTPPVPEDPPELKQQVARLQQQVAQAQQRLDSLRQRRQATKQQLAHEKEELAHLHSQRESLRRRWEEKQRSEKAYREEKLRLSKEILQLAKQVELAQRELQKRRIQQPKTVHVVSYPTPVSKTVKGQELHFQLTAGRLAYVPFEELVERLKEDARRRASQLRHAAVLSATVGPIRGYKLRYVLQKVSTLSDLGTLSFARLVVATFVPEEDPPGVPLEQALAASSEFRALLARVDPKETTITVWVHPDSFGHYRRLKKELYEMGFAVAARPLPQGRYISASPSGSYSEAQ